MAIIGAWRVNQLQLRTSSTYLDVDADDNLVLLDTVTGQKTLAQLADRTITENLDMNLFQILEFRVENLGTLPGAGNLGRLIYLTTDSHLYLDQG